jgi:hypothetical protein
MTDEAKKTAYIIVRSTAGLPKGILPPVYNGQLFERAGLDPKHLRWPGGTARPTGRVEQTRSGPAEVYEVTEDA